jgi:hypothetical protein
MPLVITEQQMIALDSLALGSMVERIAKASVTLRADLCAEAASRHDGGLQGFVTAVCEQGYAGGLDKAGDLASFAGICLFESRCAPSLPRFYAFVERALQLEEPGDVIMSMIESRLADIAAASPETAELAGFLRAMRDAV